MAESFDTLRKRAALDAMNRRPRAAVPDAVEAEPTEAAVDTDPAAVESHEEDIRGKQFYQGLVDAPGGPVQKFYREGGTEVTSPELEAKLWAHMGEPIGGVPHIEPLPPELEDLVRGRAREVEEEPAPTVTPSEHLARVRAISERAEATTQELTERFGEPQQIEGTTSTFWKDPDKPIAYVLDRNSGEAIGVPTNRISDVSPLDNEPKWRKWTGERWAEPSADELQDVEEARREDQARASRAPRGDRDPALAGDRGDADPAGGAAGTEDIRTRREASRADLTSRYGAPRHLNEALGPRGDYWSDDKDDAHVVLANGTAAVVRGEGIHNFGTSADPLRKMWLGSMLGWHDEDIMRPISGDEEGNERDPAGAREEGDRDGDAERPYPPEELDNVKNNLRNQVNELALEDDVRAGFHRSIDTVSAPAHTQVVLVAIREAREAIASGRQVEAPPEIGPNVREIADREYTDVEKQEEQESLRNLLATKDAGPIAADFERRINEGRTVEEFARIENDIFNLRDLVLTDADRGGTRPVWTVGGRPRNAEAIPQAPATSLESIIGHMPKFIRRNFSRVQEISKFQSGAEGETINTIISDPQKRQNFGFLLQSYGHRDLLDKYAQLRANPNALSEAEWSVLGDMRKEFERRSMIAEDVRYGITDAEMHDIIQSSPVFGPLKHGLPPAQADVLIRSHIPALFMKMPPGDVDRMFFAHKANLDIRLSKHYADLRERTRRVLRNPTILPDNITEIDDKTRRKIMRPGVFGFLRGKSVQRTEMTVAFLNANIETMKQVLSATVSSDPQLRGLIVAGVTDAERNPGARP